MKIRAYQFDDAEAILKVWYHASKVGHPFLDETCLARHRQLIQAEYLGASTIWVTMEADDLIGFIGLFDSFIGALFIDPAHHRQGIGRLLIEHVSCFFPSIEVEVYELNRAGYRFYQRCGFREVSRRFDDETGEVLEVIRLKRCFT